jgi:hypothetical protein
MRIARIFAHRVELPLVEGRYAWSGGNYVDVFDVLGPRVVDISDTGQIR